MEVSTVRAALNKVVDPCSAARGVPIGLTDMGMVRNVRIEQGDGGAVGVVVTLRVTSPGCMLGMEFGQLAEQEVRQAGAGWVRVEWDTTFDWTEEEIAGPARQRLRQRRTELLSIVSPAVAAPAGPDSAPSSATNRP